MFDIRKRDRFDADAQHGGYSGEGIWWCCAESGRAHEVTDAGFLDHLETLCVEIGRSSAAELEAFDLHRGDGRWQIHPEAAMFVFTTADGRRAAAEYGVIGSWNESSHSWLWAWGFPDDWLEGPEAGAARRLRAEGERRGWRAVTERHLLVNMHQAWHLTDLAAGVAGWPMVYRAKVNEANWHTFAIDRLTWLN